MPGPTYDPEYEALKRHTLRSSSVAVALVAVGLVVVMLAIFVVGAMFTPDF